jgi:hypothetical protein
MLCDGVGQRREKGEERRKKGGGACKGKIDIS